MYNTRQSFKLKEKNDIVHSIDLLIKNGHGLIAACYILGIPSIYYHHWRKVIEKVGKLEDNDGLSHSTRVEMQGRSIPGAPVFLNPPGNN
jgi:hypothetical protein